MNDREEERRKRHPANAIKRPHRHHTGKRGWKRETIYVLKKQVKIPARFPFYSVAHATVRRLYTPLFGKNLLEALKE